MTKEEIEAVLGAMSTEQLAALIKGKSGDTYKVRELVEVTFGGKPDKETREELKKAGYHWNAFEKVWHAYKTPEAMEFINKHGVKEA